MEARHSGSCLHFIFLSVDKWFDFGWVEKLTIIDTKNELWLRLEELGGGELIKFHGVEREELGKAGYHYSNFSF